MPDHYRLSNSYKRNRRSPTVEADHDYMSTPRSLPSDTYVRQSVAPRPEVRNVDSPPITSRTPSRHSAEQSEWPSTSRVASSRDHRYQPSLTPSVDHHNPRNPPSRRQTQDESRYVGNPRSPSDRYQFPSPTRDRNQDRDRQGSHNNHSSHNHDHNNSNNHPPSSYPNNPHRTLDSPSPRSQSHSSSSNSGHARHGSIRNSTPSSSSHSDYDYQHDTRQAESLIHTGGIVDALLKPLRTFPPRVTVNDTEDTGRSPGRRQGEKRNRERERENMRGR